MVLGNAGGKELMYRNAIFPGLCMDSQVRLPVTSTPSGLRPPSLKGLTPAPLTKLKCNLRPGLRRGYRDWEQREGWCSGSQPSMCPKLPLQPARLK